MSTSWSGLTLWRQGPPQRDEPLRLGPPRRGGTPTFTAQRYLKRVRYGNTVPDEPEGFLFELVLDYGEHAALSAPTSLTPPASEIAAPDESGESLVREDPFSSFKPGFDLRTYRLCRRVLMFHCFGTGAIPDDFDGDLGPVNPLRAQTPA